LVVEIGRVDKAPDSFPAQGAGEWADGEAAHLTFSKF
jgi:hypothetical protein